MPKKVDHEQRRRQITDAVCRITLRGGLGAATFRQIAVEADMSVPLVQHYFASKAELLETTQRHVGERSTARLLEWIGRTDGSPRAVLGAFLKSFIPADEESRTAGLMYLALYSEAIKSKAPDNNDSEAEADSGLVAGGKPRKTEAESMADLMFDTIVEQLNRGPLQDGVEAKIEAPLLAAATTGLGQYVVLGAISYADAYATIDYHLDRAFGPLDT